MSETTNKTRGQTATRMAGAKVEYLEVPRDSHSPIVSSRKSKTKAAPPTKKAKGVSRAAY